MKMLINATHDPAVAVRVAGSRAALLTAWPLVGVLASPPLVVMRPVAGLRAGGEDIIAAASDKEVFLTPAWGALAAAERDFVLAHEVLHIVRGDSDWAEYHERVGSVPVSPAAAAADGPLPGRTTAIPYDAIVANTAMDAIINAALKQDGVGSPPADCVVVAGIGHDMDTATAYAVVYAMTEKKQASACGSSGSGAPGTECPGEGESRRIVGRGGFDALVESDGLAPAADAELARMERAAAVARAKTLQRSVGAATSSAVAEMLGAAAVRPVNWRDELSGELVRATSGGGGWDWRRPDRRTMLARPKGYFAPRFGGRNRIDTVVVVGDTSGSMSDDDMRWLVGHTARLVEDLTPARTILLWCSNQINGYEEVDDATDFARVRVPRGGGTDFRPAFKWAAEHIPPERLSAVVYITDGWGVYPLHGPDCRTVWLTMAAPPPEFTPPFGRLLVSGRP